MAEEILAMWLVKASADEYIPIEAASWECGGNGLIFYVGGKRVAWFREWHHFREIVDPRDQILLKLNADAKKGSQD